MGIIEHRQIALEPRKILDDAILTVNHAANSIHYSYEKLVSILVSKTKMDVDEAIEYIDRNILPMCNTDSIKENWPTLVYENGRNER